MKATYGEIEVDAIENGIAGIKLDCREIFKDPITDDGTKRSKKGLLCVENIQIDSWLETAPERLAKGLGPDSCWKIQVEDQCTWEQESKGLLKTVFKDGQLVKTITLDMIREKLKI